MLYNDEIFFFRSPLAKRDDRIICVLIYVWTMDTTAVTVHSGCLSQLLTTTRLLYVYFWDVLFFLPFIFAFTIYYNRFGSVTLFGFKLRETLNMAVVFLRYLLRPAPDPTVARAFPRVLQGHLPRLLPLSNSGLSVLAVRNRQTPKKPTRVVRILYIYASTAVSPLCYPRVLIIPSP